MGNFFHAGLLVEGHDVAARGVGRVFLVDLEVVLAVGGPAWGLWALWHRRKRRSAWERPLRPGLAPWKLAVCPAYVVAAAALLARLVLS